MTSAFLRGSLLTGLLVLATMLTGFVLTQWFAATERSNADDLRQASSVAAILTSDTDADTIARVVARMPAGAEGRLAVHLPDGRTIGVAGAPDLRAVSNGDADMVSADGQDTLLYPVGDAVIEVRARVTGDWREAGTQFAVLLITGLLAVGAALVGVRLRFRQIVDAVRALARATGELEPGSYRSPLYAGAVPELTELSSALASVSARWAVLLTDERKVMADLSHRLRTPLTALRLDSETLDAHPVGDRIRRSIGALEREVDQVIAGPEASVPPEPCDISEVVCERMTFWHTLADAQARSCSVERTTSAAKVPLTQRELLDVLDSLLVNVFQHTEPGVPFATKVLRHGRWITLVVEDGGDGIADPRAALRRGSSSAGSTGLGLDIVRKCVEAVGGSIHLERSALGGTRVRLRLPEAGTATSKTEQPLAWRLWSATRSPGPA